MGDLRHVPFGLGRLPNQSNTGRTTFASYPPLPLDQDCEARVDPDITGTGTGPTTLEASPLAHATRVSLDSDLAYLGSKMRKATVFDFCCCDAYRHCSCCLLVGIAGGLHFITGTLLPAGLPSMLLSSCKGQSDPGVQYQGQW